MWDAVATSSIAERLPQLPGLVASEGSGRAVSHQEFAHPVNMTSAPPSGSDEPSCVLQALHADKSVDAHVERVRRRRPKPSR